MVGGAHLKKRKNVGGTRCWETLVIYYRKKKFRGVGKGKLKKVGGRGCQILSSGDGSL